MKMKLIPALRHFFGFRQGQGLSDFVAECKELTDQDKAEFITMLNGAGYNIIT